MCKKILHVIVIIVMMNSCHWAKQDTNISSGHINEKNNQSIKQDIPKPISISPALPKPTQQIKEKTHTVIVNNVPVEELIFSLARDAKLNADIDSDVGGMVTLNAINQPLSAILDRISQTADLTYTIKNNVLRIRRDIPVLKYYRIDYINMSRTSESTATVSTQIGSTGQGAVDSSGGGNNNSSTEVKNTSKHEFWDTLQSNIEAIIYVEGAAGAAGDETVQISTNEIDSEEPLQSSSNKNTESHNPNIILNRESGILGVRATLDQHNQIEIFINEVLYSSRRQVLIEATIAEVSLSDTYQAGIDWALLADRVSSSTQVAQAVTDIALFDRPAFTLQLESQNNGDTIQSTLSALSTFGDVRIMSSPKVMTLNNQTALLKVVDNVVYFSVDVSIERGETSSGASNNFVTYETEINTVPVGFVMSVTPYISEHNSVTLNVRPTISRVIAQARDPNPALAEAGVVSEIPVIQVREVESILKVDSGDTAVMGGLMQDELNNTTQGIPFLSGIPGLGALFRYDSDALKKTELVIFIRPVVIHDASMNGDFKSMKEFLPGTRW